VHKAASHVLDEIERRRFSRNGVSKGRPAATVPSQDLLL
jgi:hypothetical protein